MNKTYEFLDHTGLSTFLDGLDKRFVHKTGDTVTGELNVSSLVAGSLLVQGDARFVNTIQGTIERANADSNGANIANTYLKLSGGTMTGALTLKSGLYTDSYSAGALHMGNSNIDGINSLYTADYADDMAEGIHFYRDSTHVDSLTASGGTLYFMPNRMVGGGGAFSNANTVLHSGNYTSYAANKVTLAGTNYTQSGGAITITAANLVSAIGTNAVARATGDKDGNAIDTTYLKKSGGTMTGNITFANNKYLQGTKTDGTVTTLLSLDNGNNVNVAYGAGETCPVRIYGNPLQLYNGARTKVVEITAAGKFSYAGINKGTDSADRPIWISYSSGGVIDNTIPTYTDAVTINPSTGNIKATTFTGALSGNATSASKLTTSAGSTTQPIYFSNGVPVAITGAIANNTTGNAATATTAAYLTNSTHTIGNKSNYPFHRLMYTPALTGSWIDKQGIYLITQGYIGGNYGIFRVTVRTNDVSTTNGRTPDNSSATIEWIIRKGFAVNAIQAGFRNTGGNTYIDVYYKSEGAYASVVIARLQSGGRGNIDSCYTFVNSSEANDTTATDKKTSSEVYAKLEVGTVNIEGRTYTHIITPTDAATVNYANSAGTASKLGTSTVGGTDTPIYLNAGVATAITGTLKNNISGNAATATTAAGLTTSAVATGYRLQLKGETVGSNALNPSKNPYIEFSNVDRSQYCQLIYCDYDSIQAPDSLTLVGNQTGTYFIAPNIKATSNVTANGGVAALGIANTSNQSAITDITAGNGISVSGTQVSVNPSTQFKFTSGKLELKEATNQLVGGIKVGGTFEASSKLYPVQLDNGYAFVSVPWYDTAYSAGTGLSLSNGEFSVNTNTIATKTYVNESIAALPTPMQFKGSLGTGGTITSLPSAAAANNGYTYKVITAGTYASQAAKVGDVFISNGSSWILVPSGDEPSGTVTSVGLNMPTGFSVSSSPVTSSGTLTVAFASGYSLPTTAKQGNWDTAYGWGNHASAGYLKSVGWANLTNNADSLDEGSSDVTDNTELFTSYASNNGFADTNAKGKVYRRDAVKIFNYVKGKLPSWSTATSKPSYAWSEITSKPSKLSDFTDDLGSSPTHTHSQYLTSHQSLANYVTLDGAQTISGKKTFTGDIVVGSCTLHYDSTNACLQFNF